MLGTGHAHFYQEDLPPICAEVVNREQFPIPSGDRLQDAVINSCLNTDYASLFLPVEGANRVFAEATLRDVPEAKNQALFSILQNNNHEIAVFPLNDGSDEFEVIRDDITVVRR
jgi:hypothetical protein